jgi:long-chain acyl-CoA synthetase
MALERLFDLLPHYLEKYDWKQDVIAGKENGEWRKYSIQEYITNVTNLSYGFINLGIQKGDRIATITNNRPEWNFTDMAIMQTGAYHIPIYPTISPADYEYIFNHAQVKYVFIAGKELYHKIKDIIPNCPSVKQVFSFSEHEELSHYEQIMNEGKQNPQAEKLETIKNSINTNDIATIIYTSGTTGVMKGVMLSHLNIISNFLSCSHVPPTGAEGKALSYLPLCHIYERMINYIFQYKGISIYYAESVGTIVDNLKEIKPEIMTSVPRLLEKVYDKIIDKGNQLTGIKKSIFDWSIKLGLDYDEKGENSTFYNLKLAIARKLVFSKWQEVLGGNIKVIISGGAALQPRLGRIFNAAGIPMREGYGLTETSPVIAVNHWGQNNHMIGTVGPVLGNLQVKIAEDDEILVKGPSIMKGYYLEEAQTKEVLTEDGWFHTGDTGELVEGRFLKITGRKKDLFKTSFGKYVAPSMIESKMMSVPFIDNIVVVGENKKFVGAIIIPNFDMVRSWCKRENHNCPENDEIMKMPELRKRIQEDIKKINLDLAEHERIKTFELINDEWNVESGVVTAKLNVKRKAINEKYKDIIEKMFA